MASGPYLLLLLILAVLYIIYATASWKLHPFLVLLVTSFALGLLAGLPAQETIQAITEGFGGTLGYIGIVIAAGTVIGAVLERSGGALVMADTVVRWVGQSRSALAMSLTGAVISIPVFCDSGFVILSSLNRSLAIKARRSLSTFAVALSMGLYATHVFVPPTPGPIAAAGELGADIGTVIILGVLTTLPVLAATYVFARYMGQRIYIDPETASIEETPDEESAAPMQPPAPWQAFSPVIVPVLLIALRSVAELPTEPFGTGVVSDALRFLGDPNAALLLGVFLAFGAVRQRGPRVYGEWVSAGLRSAGTIILITGVGGALGSVLQATPVGDYLGSSLAGLDLGPFNIMLPFLIAAALKTALGSSTVAIITAASLIVPLLPAMGLASEMGPVLATLAIGAGAMTVSHANDSYFWVVSQFSGMDVSQAYRLQTLGSAVAGLTGIATVLVLSLLLL